MDENNSIQLFEDRKIRTAWDEEQEEWYFSVVDVIAVLTDSSNPTDYLKKMRKRDEQLASYLGTNCPQVAMMGATGKKRACTLQKRTPGLYLLYSRTGTPLAFKYAFSSGIGSSLKWNRLAASTASALPSVKASKKCSALPAPPLAITGTPTASLTARVSSKS